MCDGGPPWNNSFFSNSFYHQYLQQHARMTQWVQQLHQNIAAGPCSLPPNNHGCQCCLQDTFSTPLRNNHMFPEQYSQPKIAQEYEDEMVDEEELDFSQDDDEYSSEDEIVFNADAIIAMRAAKEALSTSEKEESEESFELVDSVKDDLFEYVELNTFGRLESKIGTKSGPDTEGEVQNEKEQRKVLYGEKADQIAGLETTMAINFDHLCDVHQPHLWPVLPVLL